MDFQVGYSTLQLAKLIHAVISQFSLSLRQFPNFLRAAGVTHSVEAASWVLDFGLVPSTDNMRLGTVLWRWAVAVSYGYQLAKETRRALCTAPSVAEL